MWMCSIRILVLRDVMIVTPVYIWNKATGQAISLETAVNSTLPFVLMDFAPKPLKKYHELHNESKPLHSDICGPQSTIHSSASPNQKISRMISSMSSFSISFLSDTMKPFEVNPLWPHCLRLPFLKLCLLHCATSYLSCGKPNSAATHNCVHCIHSN